MNQRLYNLLENMMKDDNKDYTINKKIVQFFKNIVAPSDDLIHHIAEYELIDPSELEEKIYAFLGSFLGEGKSKNFNGNYDPEQLKMGIRIEMEHTTNPLIAEKIAKDHLVENPKYYSYLKEMEAKFENNKED